MREAFEEEKRQFMKEKEEKNKEEV